MSDCCGEGLASRRRSRPLVAAAAALIAAGALAAPAGAAVTATDHTPAINVANRTTDVTVSGISAGATDVSVTITDGTTTLTSTATLGAADGSWSASFPSAGINTLADGILTVNDSSAVPGPAPGDPPTVVTGAPLQITKDTVAPGASTATPGTGTYTATQQVALTNADATAAIHVTTDGTVPTAASPTADGGPVAVAQSMRVRAVAVDPAGNAGPIASFTYVINPPVVAPTDPPTPTPTPTPATPPATAPAANAGAAGPTGTAATTATSAPAATGGGAPGAAPATPAGAAPAPAAAPAPVAAVTGLGARAPAVGILSVTGRLTIRSLRRRGLRIGMRLNAGTKAVSVRIQRVRGGRSVGRPLVGVESLPAAPGRFTVALKPRQVRRLRAGRYLVQVRARGAETAFGRATSVLIAVGR